QDFAVFVLIAVLLVPGVSAFGGAALHAGLGDPYWLAWNQWFLGDALAQLIVTPAILYLMIGGLRNLKALDWARRAEGGLCIAGLGITGYFASHMTFSIGLTADPRFYAPILFMCWAAIRFGMFGASAAVTTLAVLLVEVAAGGRGPFAGQSPAQ